MIMESSLPSYDDEMPRNHLSRSYNLELAYQESTQKTELILRDEGARRLRLRIFLLEDENEELHRQLAQGDNRTDELEQDYVELKRQFEQTEECSYRFQAELRTNARELNNLKAELSSMNGLSVNSTKLLTEKLSLARELATLRPELDHLRSQSTYQQTILAEKLALQRQVSTLEVELQTEKRATKRSVNPGKDSDRENELHEQLDEVRKELFKERQEREKARRAEERSSSWDTREAALESKIEQQRVTLRENKRQVKELQKELAQVQAALTKPSLVTLSSGIPAKTGRKRPAIQISTDAVIGTPDGVLVRGKRNTARRSKADAALPGEKSMFSITPFLNRTLSVAPETPQHDLEQQAGKERGESKDRAHNVDATTPLEIPAQEENTSANINESIARIIVPKPTKKIVKKTVLSDAKNANRNLRVFQSNSRAIGTLEKVMEEVDENVAPDSAVEFTGKPEPLVQHQATASSRVEPKKKRRKLLGVAKTIFDEEDGEGTKRPTKVMLGPPKTLNKGIALGKNNLRGRTGENSTGLGNFSPLKKDRRGAQASFLV